MPRNDRGPGQRVRLLGERTGEVSRVEALQLLLSVGRVEMQLAPAAQQKRWTGMTGRSWGVVAFGGAAGDGGRDEQDDREREDHSAQGPGRMRPWQASFMPCPSTVALASPPYPR
jgi:hypothetical protein